ncbi:MAG: PAS domain S-box protein [Planctomycetota bacterium]|nr:PAS domain S-box protein [Planctomycetota bacterium]
MAAITPPTDDHARIRLAPMLPNSRAQLDAGSYGCPSVFDGDSHLFHGMSDSQQLSKLRTIAHSAPGLISYFNTDCRFQFVNQQHEEWFGLSKRQILGRSLEQVMTPDTYRAIREYVEAALNGENVSFESVATLGNGEERWTMSTYVPDFKDDGEIRGVFSLVSDITDCRTAEKSLRESEERFRQLAEHISEVFWVSTADHDKVLYVSPAYERIWGCKCEDLLANSKHWLELVHREDRRGVLQQLLQPVTADYAPDNEYRILRPDGQTRWIRDRGFPVLDDKGNVYRIVGIAQDITRQKDTEEALRRSNEELELRVLQRTKDLAETNKKLKTTIAKKDLAKQKLSGTERRFRLLFESAPDPIFIENRAGKVLDVNPAACELHNQSRESLVGKSVVDLVPPRLRDAVAVEFPNLFAGRIDRTDGVSWTADGREVPVSVRAKPIDYDGQAALLLHVRDISKEKSAEDVLQRDRDKLEELVQQRTVELSQINQDLEQHRSKLRVLASEASMAEERERRRIAANLHDSVCQSLALAKMRLDILRQSLTDEQQQSLDDVRRLLERSIQDSRTLVFDLSPPVLYELGFEPAVRWLADRVKTNRGIRCAVLDDGSDKPLSDELSVFLFQAVRELLINVAKHAQTGKACVSICRRQGFLRVCVKDGGVGFRMHAASTMRGEGFGLYSIGDRLDLLGGRMYVQSRPGRGTKVSLLAPLKDRANELRYDDKKDCCAG